MDVNYQTINGNGWQWVEDYAYASATYVVACPPNRRCQVGMGVFAFGEPLGEKIRFSGELEITVIGAGALHFRVDDDQGPCRVGVMQKSNHPITWNWKF